jgi:hypothetical protein
VEDTVLLLNESKEGFLYQPFNFESVKKIYVSETIPNAGSLEVSDTCKNKKIGRSNIVFELGQMNLFLKYLQEITEHGNKTYDKEVEFNDKFPIKVNTNGV